MGKKNNKRQKSKYEPLDEKKITAIQQTAIKRIEVETPFNQNIKKDLKKSLVEDTNKLQEPLIDGTKFDAVLNESKHSINECNSNEKEKKLRSDQNINSSKYLDNEAKSENKSSKTVFELSNECSKSIKKKKTKTSLSDQLTKNSSSENTDFETKNINKNHDEVSEECLFSHKSLNDPVKKLKCKISNSNKVAKQDEKILNKSSNLIKTNMSKRKEHEDQISNNNSDEIKHDCNELETPSTNYKQKDKIKKDIRNQSSKWLHNTYDNKTVKVSNTIKNDSFEDRSQSYSESESCLKEIDQDLFMLPNNFALAHCVAEDLQMGAGIAVEFKIKYGSVGKLIDQNLRIGDVGVVNRYDQFVFYLITKEYSTGKPTMMTMKKVLVSLLCKMKELQLTKLGIPKIGCGLDRLDWSNVKSQITKIFYGSGIDILVCIPTKILDRKPPLSLYVYITPKNVWEMEAQTDIIIFIDLEKVNKNDWTDDVLNKVDVKYPFKEKLIKDVKNKKIKSGELLWYKIQNEKIFCVFFEQKTLYSCVEDLFRSEHFKSKSTNYLAIQSGSLNSDETFKHIVWIVLIFRSISSYNELWLCGFTEQKENSLPFDQYYKNMRYSNYNSFNLPMSRDYKYNDSNQNFYSKERSYNSLSMSKNSKHNDNNQRCNSKERSSNSSSMSRDYKDNDNNQLYH